MTFLEQRGQFFRLIFTFNGQRFTHSIGTKDRRTAEGIRGGVEQTIFRLEQGLIDIPPDALNLKNFILSGGKVAQPSSPNSLSQIPQVQAAPDTFNILR